MEHRGDTDHHLHRSFLEGKLPIVLPLPELDSQNDVPASKFDVPTINITEGGSEHHADDHVPKLGSPFQSPKLRARDVQHDMSSKDDEQVGSPANGDTTNNTPQIVILCTNAQEMLAASEHSIESHETLVATPQQTQKFSTNPTTSVIIKEVDDQDDTTIPDAAINLEAHIVTKPNLDQHATASVTSTTESKTTNIEESINSSDADTKTVVENASSTEPNHSVPPHMRPHSQPPAAQQYSSRGPRQTMPIPEGPRTLEFQRPFRREQFGHNMQYPPTYRSHTDREQEARFSAQLMKIQNELNAERKRSIHLRSTIEAEEQTKTEAAMSTMLNDLLQRQITAFTQTAQNATLARNIQHREQKVTQLEVFLAEGQKQFAYELDARGVRSISAIEREHVKRSTELELKKDIADAEAKIAEQAEELRLREETQHMREKQYKAVIRSSLEREIALSGSSAAGPQTSTQSRVQPQVQAATLAPSKAAEIADLEYNRGFAAGKAAAAVTSKATADETRKKAWCEGYAAAHQAHRALADLRSGRVDVGSPELEFLWDAGHVSNLYSVGMRIASVQSQNGVAKENAVTKEKELTNGEAKADTKQNGAQKVDKEREKVAVTEEAKYYEEEQEPAQHAHVQVKKTSPVAPAPPTFAAQLRGKQAMHNGHVVLAGCSEKEKENLIDLMG